MKNNLNKIRKFRLPSLLVALLFAGIISACASTKLIVSHTQEVINVNVSGVKTQLRLAHWSKNTWKTLPITVDGNTIRSAGDISVECVLKPEDTFISYTLSLKSKNPTRIALLMNLPETTENSPVFHVLPGLLFGDNNLANVKRAGDFHHLTKARTGHRAFSPVWEFRADRAAMPISAMCAEKNSIAISIDPYAKAENNRTVPCGLRSALASPNSPASCGVTLGYANFPYTYPFQTRFLPAKQAVLQAATVKGRIYAEATSDRRAVNRFVRKEYKFTRTKQQIKQTRRKAMVATANAMRDAQWSEKDGAFCNLYFQNGVKGLKGVHRRTLQEIGWCGGPSIALPAIQAGLYLKDDKLLQQGLDTCNVVPTLLNPKSGFLYDNGMTGNKSVDGWWSGRSGRNRHWAYNNGSCISDLMTCAEVLESAGKKVPKSWGKIAEKVLDNMASLQLKDGNLGFSYATDRPAITDTHGCIGAWWIPGFAIAARRLNKPEYLKVARRALDYYHQFYKLIDVNGASMDTGKSPNEESAHAFIRAARVLHEMTGDDYYLEALRDGIDLECLWRYGYQTNPLFPPLSNSGWNSCGGSVTSVANPCIHPMGIRISDDMRYYAKVTGDQYVYKRWEDGIDWSVTTLSLYPKQTGFGPYGITSERYAQSDGMLYKSSHEKGMSSIWSASHCFGVSAMLEGLLDAVREKPFSYKKIKDK